jgi:type IV pilus assembly protein PilA
VVIRKAQGFALIDMIFVCGIVGILCGIALPRLLLARQAAGAASAIGSMRTLNSAELTYALTCGNGFYAPKLTTLGVVPVGSREAFVSPDLSETDTVIKSGYTIQLSGTAFSGAPASCNGLAPGEAAQGYKAAADPASPENPRFFAVNSNGSIYEDSATMFASMPETGDPPSGHVLH